MVIRAYLRASTKEQDASRAKEQLKKFASDHNTQITTFYIENQSGASLERPELQRLIEEAREGEILLCEAIDRLSRHEQSEWQQLRGRIESTGLRIVAADMPLTWSALRPTGEDPITDWVQRAMSNMLLDVMAAFARRDYERRRHVQFQGIQKAKAAGLYRGKAPNVEMHAKIREMLKHGFSIRKTASVLGCSPSTVMNVKKSEICSTGLIS